MRYEDYLSDTEASADEILQDWRWLVGDRLQLWQVTKFGDGLLRNPQDGSIHFLDCVSGTCERIAGGAEEFDAAVATEKGKQWLMCDVVRGQELLGMKPGKSQCLSFKKPPVLGGKLEPSNFELSEIRVHFSIAGQLHRQIKNLPGGTRIDNVVIEAPGGPAKSTRPWWRFW